MALNLAPFGRWTLRDNAAQRRLALRSPVASLPENGADEEHPHCSPSLRAGEQCELNRRPDGRSSSAPLGYVLCELRRSEMTSGLSAPLAFLRLPQLTALQFRWAVLIFASLPLLWTGALAASAQTTSEWAIHTRGLGRLTVGMTLDEARQLPGIHLEEAGPPPVPADYCTYFRARLVGREFRVRVMMDRVNRIEVTSPGFGTLSGVTVGDSIERVKVTYGSNISIEPHHYLWDQGFVLMVLGPYKLSGGEYGVAFVASPTKGVTEIWTGRYDEIRQSEGCE